MCRHQALKNSVSIPKEEETETIFNIHSSSFPQGILISDGSLFSEPISLLRKNVHLGEVEIPQ